LISPIIYRTLEHYRLTSPNKILRFFLDIFLLIFLCFLFVVLICIPTRDGIKCQFPIVIIILTFIWARAQEAAVFIFVTIAVVEIVTLTSSRTVGFPTLVYALRLFITGHRDALELFTWGNRFALSFNTSLSCFTSVLPFLPTLTTILSSCDCTTSTVGSFLANGPSRCIACSSI